MVNLFAALIIVIGSASSTYASVDSASLASYCKVMPTEDEKRFKLIYQSPVVENVQIQLMDEKQSVIYTEVVSETNGFVKSFDLTSMPEGTYLVKVESKDYSYTQPVKVTAWKAEKLHFSVIESDSKYAFVGKNDSKEDITLFILDQEGNSLYEEEIKAGEEVKKMYNLEKVFGQKASFAIYGEAGLIKEKVFEL